MSLLVAALVAGGVFITGAGVWLRRGRRAPEAPATSAQGRLVQAGFSVELGEVVSVGRDELWLQHAWLMSEGDTPVAAAFFAESEVVVALPAPRSALYRVQPIDEPPFTGDPPNSLEHAGKRFERRRRIPVKLEELGTPPDVPWPEALLSEYHSLEGQALWLLGHASSYKAWCGRRVEDMELERWGTA